MDWKAQQLTLTLASDMHCGDMPLGFVAGAFPFVPCHIPFFSLVPAVVAGLGMPDRRASYKAVEDMLAGCVRFTPLYVSHEGRPLFPWEDDSLRLLETLYISGKTGVKLDTLDRSAIDAHLFETEVMLAAPRRSGRRAGFAPTRLLGAVFWKAGREDALALDADAVFRWNGREFPLDDALAAMRLGGDRTRSLGGLARAERAALPAGGVWGAYPVELGGEWPALIVPDGKKGPLPLLRAGDASGIHGDWCVLTGRRYKAPDSKGPDGFGLAMDEGRIAWKAGWKRLDGNAVRIELCLPRAAALVR